MAKSDPTKNPEFQRVLGNLLKAPPKPHSEMKVGGRKRIAKKKASPKLCAMTGKCQDVPWSRFCSTEQGDLQ